MSQLQHFLREQTTLWSCLFMSKSLILLVFYLKVWRSLIFEILSDRILRWLFWHPYPSQQSGSVNLNGSTNFIVFTAGRRLFGVLDASFLEAPLPLISATPGFLKHFSLVVRSHWKHQCIKISFCRISVCVQHEEGHQAAKIYSTCRRSSSSADNLLNWAFWLAEGSFYQKNRTSFVCWPFGQKSR